MRTVKTLFHARAAKGSSRPHLLACDDGSVYVVKLNRPPVYQRELVSELLGTRIAQSVGLPVPECAIVEVSPFIIASTPILSHISPGELSGVLPGLHFGSSLCGHDSFSPCFDIIPSATLQELSNLDSFAGILAFDTLCFNLGSRKAIFCKSPVTGGYQGQFINFDGCFGRTGWRFLGGSCQSLYWNHSVYRDISCWDDFEPFLSKLLTITPQDLWEMAETVPCEWYDASRVDLEFLVDNILARRSRLHALIAHAISLAPGSFPGWNTRAKVFLTSESHKWSLVQAPSTP